MSTAGSAPSTMSRSFTRAFVLSSLLMMRPANKVPPGSNNAAISAAYRLSPIV